MAYYRLTELIAPQGISQWYLGSGGTVGFHTISGLSAINHLIQARKAGRLDFEVWPHENLAPNGKKHVLIESYPAVCSSLLCPHCGTTYPSRSSTGSYATRQCGSCGGTGPWVDGHQEDAWRVIQTLLKRRTDGTLSHLFQIKEQPFGRIADVDFQRQIQFEGFILGLN